mgnify:CR=1 FL=1|tara:strand:+ start:657 stop:1496 length:840 start_codon:yes stop_codon:yes gene_type:complete
MDNIIAIGNGACNLSEHFLEYPQYSVYQIDTEPRDFDNFFQLQASSTHEDYEKNFPNLDSLFKKISGSALVIISGGGKISGCSLALLEQLNRYTDTTSILYLHPELNFLNKEAALIHNVTFGVLQEYVRSGALHDMWIVSPTMVEQIAGDLPVIGYYKTIDKHIVSAFHMINVLNHNKSEFDTFRELDEASRICTLGLVDMENSEEKLFFSLTMPREMRYYYAVNRERLETDGSFLKNLKSSMSEKLDGKTRISYGIFSTEYSDSYGYVVQRSSLIQGK